MNLPTEVSKDFLDERSFSVLTFEKFSYKHLFEKEATTSVKTIHSLKASKTPANVFVSDDEFSTDSRFKISYHKKIRLAYAYT